MNKKLTLPSHKIKIVCTIGPASRSESVLRKLVKGGMNVARLNFAHGSLEEHREDIRRIRSVASQLNQLVMILIDLPGPKIRIGKLQDEPVVLKKGASVTLTTNDILGTASLIPVNYKQLPESVAKGGTIYLNDGFIQLKVLEVSGTEVRCKVAIGGQLLSHKGLNLPNAKILIDPVTDQDLEFVEFGLQEGVETFSVSFVEKADDLIKVKEFARKRGRSINVVAKIERAEAVKNIDEILEVADAIMVARGDLGVQLPIEEVPGVQKKLIHKANFLGRPVITATQMLGSMTENIRPTRAEATDVANAILDGTDAVMLSEETTIGKYPVDTVKMMVRIAMSIEHQRRAVKVTSDLEDYFKGSAGQKNLSIEDVVSLNVIEAARALNVRFIVTPTQSGSTPRRISRFKPNCWILSFTDNKKTHHFLGLSYGVYPFEMEKEGESWREGVMKFIKKSGLVNKGDRVILTESVPPGEVEGTNSLSIITVR
ncbi:MAG: pyruvate kinase [Pseudomonadota bacterium]